MIGTVLDQVLKLTKDIVIIDSGSNDQTQQIVEEKGARFIRQDWLGWGYQKRIGEQHSSNEWILDLDADELLSDDLINEIHMVLSGNPDPAQVYSLRLVTVPPFGDIWHNINVDPRNKLYNKTVYRMPEHKAWDQLDKAKIQHLTELKGALYHYSFPNVEHMISKLNSSSSSFASTAKLKPLPVVVIRIILAIPVYFLKHYLRKGLWRAGLYGFSISMIAAFGRWMRDVKMLEIHMREQGRDNPGYK